MSFRNTFVTDFIYSAGSDESIKAAQELSKLFEDWADHLVNKIDDRGFGYYAGTNRTHGGGIEEHQGYIRDLLIDCAKVTAVPFRLTMMLESNAVITYSIEPSK